MSLATMTQRVLIAELSNMLPGIYVLPHTERPTVTGMVAWVGKAAIDNRHSGWFKHGSWVITTVIQQLARDLADHLRRRVYGRNRAVVVSGLSWGQCEYIEQGKTVVMARVLIGVVKERGKNEQNA